ncbi:30S ribosomal protein S3 [bacterium]|nr:30S ribosomal protein S3 [bacterium]
MGQKANPKLLRLGITESWADSCFVAKKEYAQFVRESRLVKAFLKSEFNRGGVSKIAINRKSDAFEAVVTIARPGIIFGKGSPDTSAFATLLREKFGRLYVIKIIEERSADLCPVLLGEWVASQLVRRIPFRRVMKSAVQRSMKAGAQGVKIACSGRLGGAEIARSEWYREGKVPLHTLRSNINFAISTAATTYGTIGIKVWISKGDVLRSRSSESR